MTSCVFGYWLGPCCRSGRSSHLSLVDFLPVGQPGKSGDISSTEEYSSSRSASNLLFWFYPPVGQATDLYIFLGRKESCLQTRCRHVCFSYCNMMALSVNLNLWKPDSTCDMKNLFNLRIYKLEIKRFPRPDSVLPLAMFMSWFEFEVMTNLKPFFLPKKIELPAQFVCIYLP